MAGVCADLHQHENWAITRLLEQMMSLGFLGVLPAAPIFLIPVQKQVWEDIQKSIP